MEAKQQTPNIAPQAAPQPHNWLDDELNEQPQQPTDRLPGMKFEENVVKEVEIDFTTQFRKWAGQNSKGEPVTKAIIPVVHDGANKTWWLNIKNPFYHDLIEAGKTGLKRFKILQTGNQAKTKYIMVK